jgi:uncharacterized membrane protein
MRHRQVIAVLALAGLFVAVYLYLYKIGVYGELKCGTGGCETVQASSYAMLLGQPVAFFGVLGYAALFAVSVLGMQPRFAAERWPTTVLGVMATIGFGFTAYLTGLEAFVIHAWCRWCLGSAAIITLIWFVALPAALRSRRPRTGS